MMKKIIQRSFCLLSTFITVGVVAQSTSTVKGGHKVANAKTMALPTDIQKSGVFVAAQYKTTAMDGSGPLVGTTTYDLATNGAGMPRIVQFPNGKVSVIWTYSNDIGGSYPDRGTGYNSNYSGNFSAAPTARVESSRTGFGSLVVDGNGKECIIAHNGSSQLVLSRNAGPGSNSWTQSILGTSTTKSAIWPVVATSGNNMYIVAGSSDTNTVDNGVHSSVYFSKSTDNGATWSVNMVPLPLIDSNNHKRAGGNSYHMAARGNVVAITIGNVGTDLSMLLSKDNGATWKRYAIVNYPVNNFDFGALIKTDTNADNITDTFNFCDGSHSVTIDANGNAHVVYPTARVYKDGTSAGYTFFYRGQINYWSTIDTTKTKVIENIFSNIHDCDGDGSIALGTNNYISGANTMDALYRTIGLSTMPTIGIKGDSLYVAYSQMMDADSTLIDGQYPWRSGTSGITGQSYRDIFVVASPNLGTNWGWPANITKSAFIEDIYPSLPSIIYGDTIPVLYQSDFEPGNNLSNDDPISSGEFVNRMYVAKVGKSEIFAADSTSSCGQTSNISDALPIQKMTGLNGKITIYPNPAEAYAKLDINLNNVENNLTVNISDLTGRVIATYNFKNVKSESLNLNVSNLVRGAYLVTVSTETATTTAKLIKQ